MVMKAKDRKENARRCFHTFRIFILKFFKLREVQEGTVSPFARHPHPGSAGAPASRFQSCPARPGSARDRQWEVPPFSPCPHGHSAPEGPRPVTRDVGLPGPAAAETRACAASPRREAVSGAAPGSTVCVCGAAPSACSEDADRPLHKGKSLSSVRLCATHGL